MIDKWPHPAEFRSGKLVKREVFRPSQYLRATLLWIREVKNAASIDDLITSASVAGRLISHFKNLDSKISSGLRKILKQTNLDTEHLILITQKRLKCHKLEATRCYNSLRIAKH